MAYNAIPDGDIDPESPITTGLMTNLRDNPIAIADGDTGAPRIQAGAMGTNSVATAAIQDSSVTSAKIASSAVTTAKIAPLAVDGSKMASNTIIAGKLKLASISLDGSINDGQVATITMNGRAFFPMIHTSTQAGVAVTGNSTDLASATSPTFGIWNNSGGTITYDVDYEYIELV